MLFMFFNAHGEYFFCTSKDFSHQQHLSATSCCWEVSIFKDWIRIFFLSKTSCTTTPEKTPKTPQNQPTGYSKHYLDPQILVGIGNSIQHLWTTCCGTKWNETCSNSFVIHLACWGAWAHESWQCSGKFGDYVVPRCTTTIVGIIIAKHRSLLRIYRSLLFIPIVVKNMYILTIVIVTTCYYQHFRKKKTSLLDSLLGMQNALRWSIWARHPVLFCGKPLTRTQRRWRDMEGHVWHGKRGFWHGNMDGLCGFHGMLMVFF